jgi:hypothetical protein
MAVQNIVQFYSPGTLIAEVSRIEIASWDVEKAMELARTIKERYNAIPYGFQFLCIDGDSLTNSPMYFLNGNVFTIDEVIARNDPSEEILRFNMTVNGIDRIIVNTNSWKTTQTFGKDDVVLEWPINDKV